MRCKKCGIETDGTVQGSELCFLCWREEVDAGRIKWISYEEVEDVQSSQYPSLNESTIVEIKARIKEGEAYRKIVEDLRKRGIKVSKSTIAKIANCP